MNDNSQDTTIDAWRLRRVKIGQVRADQLCPHPDNPKHHPWKQRTYTASSINSLGQLAPITVNLTNGYLVDGHDRAWLALDHGDDTLVEVDYVELTEDEHLLAMQILDETGQHFEYNRERLDSLLKQLQSDDSSMQAMIKDDERLQVMLSEMAQVHGLTFGDESRVDHEIDLQAKPNPRNLPLDVIYTIQGGDGTCCLAVHAGLKYGIQSARYRLCPYCGMLSGRHAVTFIDNDYFHYNHQVHLAAVQELKPKYATVMDIMTPIQCVKDGIEHHSLPQILDWAYELDEYAENVIVIPKFDCLDQIPEQFVLGYSVPTSHGGTPLQPELFQGRRVHLLGGSWKKQLAYMAVLGDDVVSVDNNYVQHIAREFGSWITPDGESASVSSLLPDVINPRYVALAISFGNMGAKINELYSQKKFDVLPVIEDVEWR